MNWTGLGGKMDNMDDRVDDFLHRFGYTAPISVVKLVKALHSKTVRQRKKILKLEAKHAKS